MPLEYSATKQAVQRNFARERGAGKPPDQAYAIAKAVQRRVRAGKKPKRREERHGGVRHG